MAHNTNRIKALEVLIKKYQKSYYNGEAEISDAEFDLLWDDLKNLDPKNPVLSKVGQDITYGFPKVKHLIPMGSQDKAANPEEFNVWAEKMLKQSDFGGFLVQYKLDGASIELQYDKGRLTKAVTRGDGIIGDEITANVRRMQCAVAVLKIPFSGGIRGEVIMTREIWQKKYTDKANCRNAANGLMRRKDGTGSEDLAILCYDAGSSIQENDENIFADEGAKISWLIEQGFNVTESKDFPDISSIVAYREKVAALRDKLPFDIDGLVIKDKTIDPADLRRNRPERQIAFKFEPEIAYSTLRQVQWSESGATYTPIGIIDPVRLAGTTVQRANLNNPDMIRAMGLHIGAAVSVVKRGEIIPKIEGLAPQGVLETGELIAIDFPKVCNSCNTVLRDEGTRLICPNEACPKRFHQRLEKWVSILDIRELGDKLLRQLYESGRVKNISDLYTLTAKELSEFERMGEISAAKVIRHIKTQRQLPLQKFTAGLNMEGVGELIMERAVLAGYDTLEKLKKATVSDLSKIWGIGDITASVIVQGITELSGEIQNILNAGIVSIAEPPNKQDIPLRGFSFCFTGELKSIKRSAAEEKVKKLGGQVKSTIVKDLSYLVTNDTESGSAKNKKAAELGVTVIDEEAFLALTGKAKGQLELF